jgi:hypothetical protein
MPVDRARRGPEVWPIGLPGKEWGDASGMETYTSATILDQGLRLQCGGLHLVPGVGPMTYPNVSA